MDEYARFTALYDPLIGPFIRPVHRAMTDTLVSHSCRSVVDLCCGTGMLAGMTTEAGIHTTGVDISLPMLNVGQAKYPAVKFIHHDATNVPLEDGMFDAATISFALHEKPLDTSRAILAEAVRLVRPGGLVMVADYRFPERRHSLLTGWGIRTVERLAGKEHFAHFTRYMQGGGTRTFLNAAGLTGEPVATFMHGWVGLFVCEN